jgi:hypothetical protein
VRTRPSLRHEVRDIDQKGNIEPGKLGLGELGVGSASQEGPTRTPRPKYRDTLRLECSTQQLGTRLLS